MVDAAGMEVVLCPASCKQELAVGPEWVRVETEDGQAWEVPETSFMALLMRYLEEHYWKKTWRASFTPAIRLGTNEKGVYIHESHRKRYFGVVREVASTRLRVEKPEAVPLFKAQGDGEEDSTKRLLDALHEGVQDVGPMLRNQVLVALFKTADRNKNGTLSKAELGTMMRRLVLTIKTQEVEKMLKEADTNHDGSVNYLEFVEWLPKFAPENVRTAVTSSLSTNKDVLRAVFRLWDHNGDGVITAKELKMVLKGAIPHFSDRQINVLVSVMDTDEDGAIEYDEFVDFLFKKSGS
jgi:Ca2+-binding EF-hand superfamily protein